MRGIALMGAALLLCAGTGSTLAQSMSSAAADASRRIAPGQFVVGAEALLWWLKKSPASIPLITDGDIGEADTKILLGGRSLDTGANPGFRINGGYGLTDSSALEASFFYIPSRSTTSSVSSNGQARAQPICVFPIHRRNYA